MSFRVFSVRKNKMPNGSIAQMAANRSDQTYMPSGGSEVDVAYNANPIPLPPPNNLTTPGGAIQPFSGWGGRRKTLRRNRSRKTICRRSRCKRPIRSTKVFRGKRRS